MINDNVTLCGNLAYGPHERNRLDLYLPAAPQSRDGLILIIHGGGWTAGDRTIHIPDAEYWSARGYICAIMDYRYVSEIYTVFDELDDITAALSTVKATCAASGYALTRMLLSGGSAGAHLALLYAYTRAADAPLRPAAVFCDCPPVDCTSPDFLIGLNGEFENWKYGVLSACCGTAVTRETLPSAPVQAALRAISPLTYIAHAVPTAICHGVKDELIPYAHVLRFLDALRAQGVRCDLVTYPQSGHALDRDPDAAAQAMALMQRWLADFLASDCTTALSNT
ncbi:MAG: alpha/beta hydrolase [Clostridia bacterium]|nr:alpha/beta hydrolase [Clostridia bacterium]